MPTISSEKKENLFKKLASKFKRTKFTDQEINPVATKTKELPSETAPPEDRRVPSSLIDVITGIAASARTLEDDRYVRYKDYEQMCLSGDTKIPLLNGKSITIKDWYEKRPQDILFVYSYDITSNSIVPGIAFSPRITKENAEVLKITFSNGKSEKVTPDHLFLLSNGRYMEAQSLKKGDKIKTLCRRISEKSRDGLEGYEMILEGNKWKFTHRIIAEREFGISSDEKVDIHHKNKDKRNNTPQNLIAIIKGKHLSEHSRDKFIKENIDELIPSSFFEEQPDSQKILKESFLNSEETLEIVEIEKVGIEEKVYDITVLKYHNFALESGAFVHNCSDPVIDGALQTYADESTQKNEAGLTLDISAADRKTEKMLKELFYDKLKINDILWKIVYEMCKYGDTFYEIIFNQKLDDILYLKYVSPYKIFRIEKEGKLIGFKYIKEVHPFLNKKEMEVWNLLQKNRADAKLIDPYKIVHFRINDNKYAPYGKSLLDSSRTVWKQLQLLEDAVIVYRLVRAPARRVWYIDTGNLSPDKALAYVNKIKNMLRKKPIIDPLTGKVTDHTKALSYTEDYWIPVRQGSTGNKVETLESQPRLGEVDDLQYFREKILFFMRIPKAFFTEEATVQLSGKSLAAMDVFFGRAVERVQKFVLNGLYKIAYIYLILKNVKPDKIKSVKLELTSPSIFMENARLEVLSNKFNLLATVKNTGMLPDVWILKEIMGMNDEEIIAVLSIMQAQQAGMDIVSVLTGKPSPYAQQQAKGTEAEFEKELGPTPASAPTPAISPPEEATPPAPAPTETTTKVPSPTELALKALLSLEGKKLSLKDKEKLLTEISNLTNKANKRIINESVKFLNLINEKKKRKEKVSGGFTNYVVLGEFKGIEDKIRKKEDNKENLIVEENKKQPSKSLFDKQLDLFRQKVRFYEGVK